ncbi:lipopolysaccharide biosynthesis protein [Aquabacterium sp.]|uniref:lipopolysaccharide biosynthesis protein n=1 Tax=Aquabacterium sp. TaxID=1872578 RepID=UPI0037841F8A
MAPELSEREAIERGRRRDRRALLTAAANMAAKLVTVATSFATIPLTLHYLGSERFGLWMTISSLSALLAFADLGLGNGLLNAMAEASGRDDTLAMRRALASAAALLSGLALLLLALLLPAIHFFDWAAVFGLHEAQAVAELKPALQVFALCFALNILAGVVQRAQLGLQLGFLNGMANAAGAVLGLLAVLLVIGQGGGLPWLVAALLGGPLLATAASGVWLLARRPALRPRRADVQQAVMQRLLRLGGLFLLLQITTALAYASDNLLGARFVGAAAVGDFAIAVKLFSVITILVPILLGPLWPAYAEAIARGDLAWVRRTLRRSTVLAGLLAALGSLLLLLAFAPLTQWWLQRQPAVPPLLLWGLALWMVVSALGTGLAMFMNGAHVVAEQAVIATVFALCCLGGKWFVLLHQQGLQALPWVTALSYLALVMLPSLLLLPRILRRLPGTPAQGAS